MRIPQGSLVSGEGQMEIYYALLAERPHFRKYSLTKVVLCDARQAPSFLAHAADRKDTAADK